MMSLYDGVGIDDTKASKKLDSAKLAGWSDNFQFMKTQLQLKKAVSKPTPSGIKANRTLTTTGPGVITLSSMTGTVEKQTVLVDEYNPLKPNDYHETKKVLKRKEDEERREKERDRSSRRGDEEDRDKARDKRRRSRSRSRERDRGPRDDEDRGRDRERDSERRRREEKNRGGAAIAPPPSLMTTPIDPNSIARKDGAGTGGFQTGNAAASSIMAKYGWKEGQGLGREEQGLSTALTVEKVGKRAGKIINKDVEKLKVKDDRDFTPPASPPLNQYVMPPSLSPPHEDKEKEKEEEDKDQTLTEVMRNPSKVVLLKNMVGPGEVDEDLQPEIEEECTTKYGEISKVIIFEIPGCAEEEAVRIFVEFKRMESAVKALVDLNKRFFGGRVVTATFYSQDRFRRLDLAS